MRLGPGQERRAFVDLVERIRAHHQRIFTAINHGLSEGKQRLAGAVDRQDIARRVQPAVGHVEAAFTPGADSLAQRRDAQGGRVHRHLVEVAAQRLGHECRGCVLRLADGQCDRTLARVRCDAAEQCAQFLERVGLQLVQGVVHRKSRQIRLEACGLLGKAIQVWERACSRKRDVSHCRCRLQHCIRAQARCHPSLPIQSN